MKLTCLCFTVPARGFYWSCGAKKQSLLCGYNEEIFPNCFCKQTFVKHIWVILQFNSILSLQEIFFYFLYAVYILKISKDLLLRPWVDFNFLKGKKIPRTNRIVDFFRVKTAPVHRTGRGNKSCRDLNEQTGLCS